jgi:hypothetical protein
MAYTISAISHRPSIPAPEISLILSLLVGTCGHNGSRQARNAGGHGGASNNLEDVAAVRDFPHPGFENEARERFCARPDKELPWRNLPCLWKILNRPYFSPKGSAQSAYISSKTLAPPTTTTVPFSSTVLGSGATIRPPASSISRMPAMQSQAFMWFSM